MVEAGQTKQAQGPISNESMISTLLDTVNAVYAAILRQVPVSVCVNT